MSLNFFSPESCTDTSEGGTDVGESVEDFDSECSDVSEEDIEARLEVIQTKFRAQTESMVNDAEVRYWNMENSSVASEKIEATCEGAKAGAGEGALAGTGAGAGVGAGREVLESSGELRRLEGQLSSLRLVMVSREEEIRELQGEGREAARERARLEDRLATLAASQVDSEGGFGSVFTQFIKYK